MGAYWLPLTGGLLIGVAVSLMLFLNGRVTGVSAILYGALVTREKGDRTWRSCFVIGMLAGGFVLMLVKPDSFSGSLQTPVWTVIAAGLLVGFGTVLGSGCTSGHGVCGMSRLSPRSIAATVTFISAGVLAVAVFRRLGVFL